MNDAAPDANKAGLSAPPLPAFAGYGVEIEYMIVGPDLNVMPLAEILLSREVGHPACDVCRGRMGWSNELALHVLEIKNLQPEPTLEALPAAFHAEVLTVNARLAALGAQLMPSGMHPWMNPRRETRLWALDSGPLYRSYDRLFDCARHGWSNLQSLHLNLPFANDEEFARLHAAIRLALPILPALAASTPWADGQPSAFLDNRLAVYRHHQERLPTSMGQCIPEPSASPAEYRARVLAPMYRELEAIAAPAEVAQLRHEWLNVRAAVPRFARSAIEIRVLDAQECPLADLAIAAAAAALIRRLYDAAAAGPADTAELLTIFEACIRDADQARIHDQRYLQRLGLVPTACRAGELWARLIDELASEGRLAAGWLTPLHFIRDHGPLARRLGNALHGDPARLPEVYQALCACLRENRMYTGPA